MQSELNLRNGTVYVSPCPAEPRYTCDDPDQLASEEAKWSGSALFAIKYVILYQQLGSNNLTGWKLKVCVAS